MREIYLEMKSRVWPVWVPHLLAASLLGASLLAGSLLAGSLLRAPLAGSVAAVLAAPRLARWRCCSLHRAP